MTSNTIWTKEDSPYQLSGRIKINPGIILSIEAGVVVDLQSCQMEVDGVLQVTGAVDERVLLKSRSGSTQKIEFTLQVPVA